MSRRSLMAGSLSTVVVAFAGAACSSQECAFISDCPASQMCSAAGTCIADERPALASSAGRNAGGEALGNPGDDFAGDVAVDPVDPGAIDPETATMTGTIGPVGGFAGPATVDVWDETASGWGATVTLTGITSDGGSGLFILYLANGLGDLEEGSTTMISDANMSGGDYVQLCSDDIDDGIHFDGIAEDTTITVTPDEVDGGHGVTVESTITEGFGEWSYADAQPTVIVAKFRIEAE